jgi:hypothetical protein
MRNRRATFVVYGLASPGGDIPADLAQALGKVLIAHQERHKALPAGLVVKAGLIGEAREAIEGSTGLEVTSSGGCLAWEVWMEISTDGHEPSKEGRCSALMETEQPELLEETPQQ